MLQHISRPLTYPIGPDEVERGAALQELGILDTTPDENFDAAVRLAGSSFDVPVALVAMLDEQREWFKAVTGWDAKEAPRELAFCNYTILQDDVFVVEDAELDPRFSENPLVTGDPRINSMPACLSA
ncbi:GAF domain-containing protein [Rhizobium herbae]